MTSTAPTGAPPTPHVTPPPTDDITLGQRMISATAGNILTGLLVTPLDVVRVRLQSQSQTSTPVPYKTHTTASLKNIPPNLGITACCREVFWVGNNAEICLFGAPDGILRTPAQPGIDCAVEETQRRTFTSTFDGLRKIARNEGLWTLWRGLSPTLMMGIPANIIYFAGYDWLRTDDRSPIKQRTSDVYAPFVAGAIARTAAAAATSPVEMFRTRLQATPGHGAGHFKATLEGLYQMTQTSGYTSLWRGLGLTMWRDVPFSGLYWWGYEKVKEGLQRTRHNGSHHPDSEKDAPSSSTAFFESFIAGATSGSLAAFVTTPFDVGKTRQQVYRHMDHGGASNGTLSAPSASKAVVPEQLSLPKFLAHILKEEGMSGLFKGWGARCLKVAPACAIMISTYELGKRMARDANERRHTDCS